MTELLSEKRNGVLLLTLNRPDKLNAYTATMGDALARSFDQANTDDDVRVIVVTGAGRAFCAGADLSAGKESFGAAAETTFGTAGTAREDSRFVDSILNCKKPSIAAINGPAVGVGITMTLAMDLRIAVPKAKLGFVFVRRGLVPEAGATWLLPRLVGLTQAMRWCYSGKMVEAPEALAAGLLSETPENVVERALEIAHEWSDGTAPVAMAITRQLLLKGMMTDDPRRILDIDAVLNRKLGAGPDVAEGVQAFLDKRAPAFPLKASADIPAEYEEWAHQLAVPKVKPA